MTTTFGDSSLAQQYQVTIDHYFDSLNREQYLETAALFAPMGCLHPPFGETVTGSDAIANYLLQEARGIKVQPLKCTEQQVTAVGVEVEVCGWVTTFLFQANVMWLFKLNTQGKVEQVKVNLLASLEDLLQWKKSKNQKIKGYSS
jgi:hypothetical protein